MGVFHVSSTAGLLNSLNHSRQVTTRELSRKYPSRQTVGKRASTDDLPQATNVLRVANRIHSVDKMHARNGRVETNLTLIIQGTGSSCAKKVSERTRRAQKKNQQLLWWLSCMDICTGLLGSSF